MAVSVLHFFASSTVMADASAVMKLIAMQRDAAQALLEFSLANLASP